MNNVADTIRIAAKIDQFIKDEDVDAAFKRVATRYYEEFRAADSSEKRVVAWAKANALEDVLLQLRITIDAGEAEVLNAAAAAKHQRK